MLINPCKYIMQIKYKKGFSAFSAFKDGKKTCKELSFNPAKPAGWAGLKRKDQETEGAD